MGLCDTCNNFQVDTTTNQQVDESSYTEQERLLSYSRYVPFREWHHSAEAGCVTCRLIWDILIYVDEKLVLEFTQSQTNDEELVYVWLEGIIGETLTLQLELPSGAYFPPLEIYSANTIQPYPIIGCAKEVLDHLCIENCLEFSNRWIKKCIENHPECKAKCSNELPTRILELGECQGPVKIRLYEPGLNENGKYVALSYCWGSFGNLTTTKATIADRKCGISWDVLPNSFCDAVAITKSLGIRYLWIDALCIIQDDISDWEREAAKMGQVYENAFLTIATTAARDPMRGILIPRSTDLASTMVETGRPKRNPKVMAFTFSNPEGNVYNIRVREPLSHNDIVQPRSVFDITYPLMSRGWTLQERLLSRRILHFTEGELIWECKSTLFCECDCISRDFRGLQGNHSPKIGFEKAMAEISVEGTSRANTPASGYPQTKAVTIAWTMIIAGYSFRQLTFSSDKLPAISGMARKFSRASGFGVLPTYLAGVWLEDIPWLLCWRAFNRRLEKRTTVYCAPTWSWASLETPVIWDHEIFDASSKVEILHTSIAPQGGDLFGQVKGGRMSLKGYVQKAIIDFDVPNRVVLGLSNEREERIYFVPDHKLRGVSDNENVGRLESLQQGIFSLSNGDKVACLWVLHNVANSGLWGLVLASPLESSISRSAPGCLKSTVFERIGIITRMSHQYQKDDVPSLQWFNGSEERVITVI